MLQPFREINASLIRFNSSTQLTNFRGVITAWFPFFLLFYFIVFSISFFLSLFLFTESESRAICIRDVRNNSAVAILRLIVFTTSNPIRKLRFVVGNVFRPLTPAPLTCICFAFSFRAYLPHPYLSSLYSFLLTHPFRAFPTYLPSTLIISCLSRLRCRIWT